MILEIFFAAGCFWGVEKNFENIEGVVDVVSGYSGGNYENPTYQDVLDNRRIQSESFLSVLICFSFSPKINRMYSSLMP